MFAQIKTERNTDVMSSPAVIKMVSVIVCKGMPKLNQVCKDAPLSFFFFLIPLRLLLA